jgi:HAMP domain-containing protein
MTRFGLRERIALGGVAASAAALVAVLLLVEPGLRERTVAHTRTTLLAEARLMARVVERPLAEATPPSEIDALVDSAAREVSARVTIIAPDGRVLADSSLSGPELAAVENHAGRPEVTAALRGETGSAIRHSATVDVGPPLRRRPHTARTAASSACARVALPLYGIEEQARDVARSVALALALAFAVAVVLAVALAAPLAGPLREMMASAHRFAAGDLSARTRISRQDEIGELARILDRSADQLQARLNELAGERARTETILSAIDSGLLAVDHRGTVILANHSLRRSLDLPDPLGTALRGGHPPLRGRAGPGGGAPHGPAPDPGGPDPPPAAHLRPAGRSVPGPGGDAARRGADLPGRDGAAARGRGPPRLRRQRIARAAHAPHVDPRLRGGPGRRRRWRSRPPRGASWSASAPRPTA